TPHGHHGIADELLDDSAISRDQRSARVEVLRQQLAHLLGVAGLRERREPDEVGEQHRDEPPLGFRSSCYLRFDSRNPPTGKRSTALPTELHGRSIRFATGGADLRQWRPALPAELPSGFVLRPARRAVHRTSPGALAAPLTCEA